MAEFDPHAVLNELGEKAAKNAESGDTRIAEAGRDQLALIGVIAYILGAPKPETPATN